MLLRDGYHSRSDPNTAQVHGEDRGEGERKTARIVLLAVAGQAWQNRRGRGCPRYLSRR
jgi:hypothetical protein